MSNSTGISRTKSGSVPLVQPVANFGVGGMSAALPRAAPASTHAAIVSISFCDRLMSLRIGNDCVMSAPQGGISRATTFALIAFAHGRASSYESSDIGATSPGRWQFAHLPYMIGATSLANVGADWPGGPVKEDCAVAFIDARVAAPTTSNARRFINAPQPDIVTDLCLIGASSVALFRGSGDARRHRFHRRGHVDAADLVLDEQAANHHRP